METITFAELGLSAKVLAAVEATGYTTPTPIQVQAIPVALTGRDVLGIAQTGTGKTAAFVMPMICRLESGRARARMPRSLILAPTRELAAQCAQSFEKYGINHKLNVALLIGGVSMDDQVQKLDRGVDVLIATPGRLLDHFGRGRIMLMGVEILVIDEADRMLDMGFIPDIEKICKLLPPKRQTLFFSATMPTEITRLVDQFLKDPLRIEVAKPATAANTITQRFRFCPNPEDWAKRERLREIIRKLDVKNAIIFSNYKRDVAILLKSLLKHGFNAGALHGDMDQMSRMATLDKFRSGEITLLAASDVAARGLDIPDVSHVINYDVPWQPDDYVHRIGRTGRAGKEGCSVTIVTPDDIKSMDAITKLIGEEPKWLGDPPDEETLAEGRTRKRGRGRGAKRSSEVRDRRSVGRRRGRGEGEGAADRPMRAERPRRERPRPAEYAGGRDERPFVPEGDAHETAERPERSLRPRRERPRPAEYAGGRDERPFVPEGDAPETAERPERSLRPRRERPRPAENAGGRDDRSFVPEGDAPETAERPERSLRPRRGRPQRSPPPAQSEQPEAVFETPFGAEPKPPSREPRRGRAAAVAERAERERVHRSSDRAGDTRRERPERRRGEGGGERVVGLGDHVPAFLRRPVRANAE